MKTKLTALLFAIAGLSIFGSTKLVSAAAGGSVLVPAAEVKWSDVPGMAGVQLAAVDGDPSKGASHFFLKFAPGFAAPLHHHTANHSGTVVAGTLDLTVGDKEQKLPPGSFFSFSGKTPHVTKCETGAACVLSMDVRGKWDVVMEKGEAKEGKKEKGEAKK
jgi:quercetin dioxygenase-like cupin family protein